ncbi:hypothetical protein QVD17_34961 [Tagetes erecta]|uniref:Uncharacterized protein n=1 Tax=Tagetes erecta TaxID=13708 RepID=A0AAD8NES3_TARER|nr:hypothetical protein QVD17_34961 [Tagetes erecta]
MHNVQAFRGFLQNSKSSCVSSQLLFSAFIIVFPIRLQNYKSYWISRNHTPPLLLVRHRTPSLLSLFTVIHHHRCPCSPSHQHSVQIIKK